MLDQNLRETLIYKPIYGQFANEIG